jgi:hypothetical protein
LALLLPEANASAQVMPRAGTHFTFGIPEGPDALVDPQLGTGTSILTLNIVSLYEGKGVISSPNGFCQEFTFSSNVVTTIALPNSFMHLKDLGKTNKGIVIRTSQPVNIVFHDFLEEAGEATQIYPDDALDTSYRVTSWGIFDDPGEDNHSQFIITATADNTDITIVPSVKVMGNHPARVPILTTLNQGECYIVKADTSGVPYQVSLVNSTIHSSKPVSVIAGITCGYVPLGIESCNQMLDEILPKKITDTIFYVVPLLDTLVQNTVLFTSDSASFWVKSTNGTISGSINGRVELQINKPQMFTVTAPAQCFLLSEGSWVQNNGDPSMVSILPRNQYSDTVLWYTPDFSDQGIPFNHFVSVIYPKASEGTVLLDGKPISSVATPQKIFLSPMAGAVAIIKPGMHRITSPVPIFATASGFTIADAYSFVTGTIAPKLPEDTLPLFLNLTSTDARTCRDFDVAITSSFLAQDSIKNVELTMSYDPNVLKIVSIQLGPLAQGGQWVSDTRTPGTITIDASCLSPFSATGAVTTVTFATGPSVTTTTISASLKASKGGSVYGTIRGSVTKDINILEIRDTIKAAFSIDAGHAQFSRLDTATVRLTSVPNEAVNQIDLLVSYNHDLLSLLRADLTNSLIPAAIADLPVTVDAMTDKIHISLPSPVIFTSPGILARLIFNTYITDSTSGNIALHAVLGNSRPCPLDILSDQAISEFSGTDTCGYHTLRTVIQKQAFRINSIIPNPSNGSFTIDIDRHLFSGDPLHISLFNMLGNEVWSTDHASDLINEKIQCSLAPLSIPGGGYFLRVSAGGHTETQQIVIRN